MLRWLKETLKIQYRELQALKIAFTEPEEMNISKKKTMKLKKEVLIYQN